MKHIQNNQKSIAYGFKKSQEKYQRIKKVSRLSQMFDFPRVKNL